MFFSGSGRVGDYAQHSRICFSISVQPQQSGQISYIAIDNEIREKERFESEGNFLSSPKAFSLRELFHSRVNLFTFLFFPDIPSFSLMFPFLPDFSPGILLSP